jgi:hypothetical protein
MGGKDSIPKNLDDNSNSEIENAKKILKGSYEDRYKVGNKDPSQFYDMIIDINSFSKKPDIIWKIITKKNKQKNGKIFLKDNIEENAKEIIANNEMENQSNINSSINKNQNDSLKIEDSNIIEKNGIVIGVIGLGNVGKSYLLSLFIDEELLIGENVHTKGISIIKKNQLIILDSEGVEAPLTKHNISKDLYEGELFNKEINESDNLIQNMAKDKKAVELFIQDFIIEKSNILFIVVGQITLSEQKLINRVVNETNKNKIFVIHNLKNLYSKEQINNYIENTFKKNIFLNFKNFSKQKYKNKNKIEFNYYFVEQYLTNNKSEKIVIHLIMASNLEKSEAFIYNKTVVDFVKNEIFAYNEGKNFNLIEELKTFIIQKGEKYTESENEKGNMKSFCENDISLEKDNDSFYLKIKNNTRLKKCLINQLGFSSFYGALYSPNYVCYFEESNDEKEKKFVIEINLCGKEKELFTINNPKREEFMEGRKTIISITGSKKLKEYKNFEKIESCTMEEGNFRIDIILDINKYKFKPNTKVIKKKKKGLIRYIYTVLNDDFVKKDNEMKPLNFDKKIKKN